MTLQQPIHYFKLASVYRRLEKRFCLINGYFLDLFVYAIECAVDRGGGGDGVKDRGKTVQNKTKKCEETEQSG